MKLLSLSVNACPVEHGGSEEVEVVVLFWRLEWRKERCVNTEAGVGDFVLCASAGRGSTVRVSMHQLTEEPWVGF